MDTIRPYGPGKFNTVVDSLVWDAIQTNGTDQELAEQGFGWRGIVRKGETGLELEVQALPAYKENPLNPAEIEFLAAQVGCIASEAEDGHVDITYFDNPEELEGAWKAIQEDYSKFIGEDELGNFSDQE